MRIGTSSYIIADDIQANVRYLAPYVDDIELVLFEYDGQDNYPTPSEIQLLRQLALDHNLSYTVHFPVDLFPGSPEKSVRDKSLDTYVKVLELCSALDPFGYILHLTPDLYGPSPSKNLGAWLTYLDESLYRLFERTNLDGQMFCAETLSYPFALVESLVKQYGLAVTLDIGHVWMMDYDAQQNCSALLDNSRVCHLHGVDQSGVDHQSLAVSDPLQLEAFLTALMEAEQDGKERVLTLEVFNQHDFHSSLSLLRQSRAMMGLPEESKLWQRLI